jgi:hypothetical protein
MGLLDEWSQHSNTRLQAEDGCVRQCGCRCLGERACVPAAEVPDDHWLMEERQREGGKGMQGAISVRAKAVVDGQNTPARHEYSADPGERFFILFSREQWRRTRRGTYSRRCAHGTESGTSRCRVRSVRADMSHGQEGKAKGERRTLSHQRAKGGSRMAE